MIFSFSWQITAVFGVNFSNSIMATSSALSHFGLFSATQSGIYGTEVSNLIPFIFAMPFLVHPFVFGIFGKAMTNQGVMPEKIVYLLASIGFLGTFFSLIF